ncbi:MULTISPECIES: cation:proton antiporter [unclassified Synechococcus]|uniref:cation:proton antiporter n=1 Tax=unclassified Synechococcus TaxID=2626047 RepID=UPI0018CF659A|nr:MULTISPECIES: cation:proton antiporter [unclassified Synechococcus]MEA5423763.1 cation:proton antiporter [Synechococcus sp. CCY9202]QPN59171.1 cation:proton antiporter [Synechococcus sp. CBW1002]QPN65959.1 cation:proton antiporter [Synechococcus sp. CBW1006]
MAEYLAANPLGSFALLLALSVLVPPLFRRMRLPDLVGLLVAGVLVGPHALGWLTPDSPTVALLSDVGVVYLLFIAGLEIDLAEFQRIRQRSFRFGLLTFSLPMVAGTALGFFSGFGAVSAVLLGSVLASHTPLGYPIVRSYGAMREESVTVAIGGTIFTDIASLLVLALCISLGQGSFSALGLVGLLVKVAVFATTTVVVIRRLGHALVRRSGDGDGRLLVAVLLALFLSAVGAELAGVEKIVGAFLAGLAVNAVLPEGPVKEQVILVGASLFIPIFFIDLGLLLDVPVFLRTVMGFGFAAALIGVLVASKGLAAWLSGLIYRYSGAEMLTLWSLSLPQVAATLAATTVGFRAGLLNETVLNSVLALMVVTAILGPALTSMAMARLREERTAALQTDASTGQLALVHRALRVMVPIANPANERALLGMASQLIGGEEGREGLVLPLAVVTPSRSEAERQGSMALTTDLARARQLLLDTEAISRVLRFRSSPLLRVDHEVAGGIARAALEQGADLLVVGVGSPARLGRWLFGDLVDGLCRQAHCPVVVTRLRRNPRELRRLLVPIKDLSASALEQVQLAERIANSVSTTPGGPPGTAEAPSGPVRITLLHLHDPRLPESERQQIRQQLQHWLPDPDARRPRVAVDVQLVPSLAIEAGILRQASLHDLVILRSQRRLVGGLPIAASDRASWLLRRLSCSTLVISDPLH